MGGSGNPNSSGTSRGCYRSDRSRSTSTVNGELEKLPGMSFSTDLAKLVADQLSRFVTLNRHQLAGQVANLDFWLGQVCPALEAIDGYGKRFQRLKAGQARHVAAHHTTEFSLDDPCCTQRKPAPPRRIPDYEMRDARRELCEAGRRFLVRCYNEGLIEESVLRQACAEWGVGVDASELRSRA
jgi:hypothetical protein